MADHQVAHVYVKDPARIDEVKALLEAVAGVEKVQYAHELWKPGIAHERGGDLICTAAAGHWFTYYFWEDDDRAPDYARTVDIHRKPGYDPAELFLDPNISMPRLKIAAFLLKKKLGLRSLMEVIPLDASLVLTRHFASAPATPSPALKIFLKKCNHTSKIPIHELSSFLECGSLLPLARWPEDTKI